MLKSLLIKGLSTAQNRSMSLQFRDLGSSYFVKNVAGLEPVEADVQETTYPDLDEDYLDGSRVGGRTVEITLGLRPRRNLNETVGSLRRALNRIVPPKTPVRLTFTDDEMPQFYVDGIVKRVTPTIFGKSSDITIVVKSQQAYLTSTTQLKGLTFPTNVPQNLNYVGDAQAPFELTHKFVRAATSVRLRINGTSMLQVTRGFNVGDTLNISTIPKQKRLALTRNGATTSQLDYITQGSLEIFFDAATDTVEFETSAGTALSTEKFSLTYSARYIGN